MNDVREAGRLLTRALAAVNHEDAQERAARERTLDSGSIRTFGEALAVGWYRREHEDRTVECLARAADQLVESEVARAVNEATRTERARISSLLFGGKG